MLGLLAGVAYICELPITFSAMRSFLFSFAMFFVSAQLLAASVHDVDYETRMVVDSARVIGMMNEKVRKTNEPVESKIKSFQTQMNNRLVLKDKRMARSAYLKSLENVYQPKVKDDAVVDSFHAFLEAELRVLPDEMVLSCAKEKDVKKAQSNAEAMAKLLSKTKEKQLKAASKGKLEETLVMQLLVERQKECSDSLSILEKEVGELSDSLNRFSSQLVPEVSVFDFKEFRRSFPGEAVPTRKIRVSVKELGPDYHPFDYYAKKYPTIMTMLPAKGRFDGMIEDELYLFPLESSISKPEWDDGGKNIYFDKLLIKSRYGTVAEGVVNVSSSMMISEDEGGAPGIISTLRDVWEKDSPERDGIFVACQPMELQGSEDFTYVYDGSKWSNRPPLNPEYMSYDECVKLLPENIVLEKPLDFAWKVNDTWEAEGTTQLIAVKSNSENAVYIKGKPSVPELKVSVGGLFGINVAKGSFGNGRDGLGFGYRNDWENGGDFYEVFCLEIEGPAASSLNGEDLCVDYYWRKGVVINRDTVYRHPAVFRIHELYGGKVPESWVSTGSAVESKFTINGRVYEDIYALRGNVDSDLGRYFPESYDIERVRANFEKYMNAYEADSLQLTRKLLKGVVFGEPLTARIESSYPICDNFFALFLVTRKAGDWDDAPTIVERYAALYDADYKLLDAVWLGQFPTATELSSGEFTGESTRFVMIGPREFRVAAFKSVDDKFAACNELNYIVADDRFLVEEYRWNISHCSDPYVWAWMEPVKFLYRFLLKSTPWDLWNEYAKHCDGENAEDLEGFVLPRLCERNPELFVKKAAKVINGEESEDDNVAYRSLNGMEDFYGSDLVKVVKAEAVKQLGAAKAQRLF